NAGLETDEQGHARFEFDLPDNLTRWRILVVAMERTNAMGLGDGSVRVNLPLQIEPALPNQVRTGDEFGAGFNVTNRTDDALQPETTLSARGALTDGPVESTTDMSLESFQHQLGWLWMTADQPGEIEFLARTRAGDLQDALQTTLPVHSPGTAVVAAEYGS